MVTSLRRTRLLPLLIGALSVGLAGVVSAQDTTPDHDAQFRQNVPVAPFKNQVGLPGGIVVLHKPGKGQDNSDNTATPIKHVILLIGENRTFDHVYGTYTPPKGQSVDNLLSKGIVNADGTPGPNVDLATQFMASSTGKFDMSPKKAGKYKTLPQMNTGGAPTAAPFASAAQAQAIEPALPDGTYDMLAAGGTGLPSHVIDPFPGHAPQRAGGHACVDQLRRLRQQPRAPLLPDVAAARLRHQGLHRRQPQRLSQRSLPLGRDHHRRGHQRRSVAGELHRPDHR
jgi:phospholipase C